VLSETLAMLRFFAAPAVIVAIVSTIVGSVLTYLGIRLNRTKEAFETRRYARSVFRDLFELNAKTDARIAKLRSTFATMFPSAGIPEASRTHDLLLQLDERIRAKDHSASAVDLTELVSRVSALHYSTQAQRTLLVHSLAELLDRYGSLLNSFETSVAYHAILVTEDTGIRLDARWLTDARAFYRDAMNARDYSTAVRLGITLVGVETERGLLADASARLSEVDADTVLAGAGFEPVFLRRRLKHIRDVFGRDS